jgi:uncharacterized membrane protein YccF (DUF307 family)
MTTIYETNRNPSCLLQLLWFLLIGWWASLLWMLIAAFLMLTIIGIPFGVIMFNSLPKVIALRQPDQYATRQINGRTVVTNVPQINIFWRIIYFIFIGWWLGFIWVGLSWLVCITIIGLPIGLWMVDQVPLLQSLHLG